MSGEELALSIVAIVMGTGIVMRWLKTKETAAKAIDPEMVAKLERVDQLEDRVRVLEKIVTNKKANLAEEIDRL